MPKNLSVPFNLYDGDEWNDDGEEDITRYDLESELHACSHIVEKCADNFYAQNLYAALCNNDFRKSEMIPILREDSWSCSWRYAGGIIANLRNEGDYLDWYNSGSEELSDANSSRRYVAEGFVTDEIRQDLEMLQWFILPNNER